MDCVDLIANPMARGAGTGMGPRALAQSQEPGADPTVVVYVEAHEQGHWSVRLICPICGELHTHGGGRITDGPPDLGHRVAHCWYGPGGGYFMMLGPPDMPRPEAQSYGKQRARRKAYEVESYARHLVKAGSRLSDPKLKKLVKEYASRWPMVPIYPRED